MTTLWCELAWLGGEAAEPGVVLELRGDRIAGIARAATPPPGSQALAGLTLPGAANAHSHAFQRALRGRTHAGAGTFWTWREQMLELAGRLEPDDCFRLARATFAECALAGMTLVGEFHYVHHAPDGRPYPEANALGDAIVAAAREAGVRLTLLDACYEQGGIPRFRDATPAAWAARVDRLGSGPAVRVGAAVHSVRAVTPAGIGVVARWAADRGAPLHAHVSEQPAENEACLAQHGVTPTALLAGAGALEARFTAVHATHLTDEDLVLLGDAGAAVCLCPTTERDLADGIAPARRIRDAGPVLALGSDSHAVIDPWEEARAVELDERLAGGARGVHRPAELLEATTAGGYASLGWPEGGRIAAGALADLTTIGLGSVRLAGTRPADALEAAVFAATAADVTDVRVGGRPVVARGRHADLDVAAELQAALEALEGR